MNERRTAVGRREVDKWSVWDKRIRDLIIYVVGIAGIVNELFLKTELDWPRIIFAGGMVGLPFVLKADEILRRKP